MLGRAERACTHCGGEGQVASSDGTVATCWACDGDGEDRDGCSACDSTGWALTPQTPTTTRTTAELADALSRLDLTPRQMAEAWIRYGPDPWAYLDLRHNLSHDEIIQSAVAGPATEPEEVA